MKTSENINELAKAMAIAQKDMKPAAKDGVNPHFRSKYSNISSVWEAIRQPLTENGLTVWQDVVTGDKTVSVTTRVIHNSGQWVEFGPLTMPLVKFDPQAIGSATSYAKRYALCAAVGVVSGDEDDDGESAMDRKNAHNKAPEQEIIIDENLINEYVNSFGEDKIYFDALMADKLRASKMSREKFLKFCLDNQTKTKQAVEEYKKDMTNKI